MSPDRRSGRQSSPALLLSEDAKRARPRAGSYAVDQGTAEILQDADAPDGWLLTLDGLHSSYVDLADPTHLDFEYMVWMGAALDALAPAGAPLRVVHLGGAACTLASYVSATRPASPQTVFELDAALLDLTREMFGVRSSRLRKLRAQEARAGLASLRQGATDVVIRDAFADSLVPRPLTTVEFVAQVRDVLAADGTYLANIADGPPLSLARSEVATTATHFRNLAVLTEPSVMRGRRRGNLVLVASNAGLPLDALRRGASAGAVPARLVEGERVRDFAAGAPLLRDPVHQTANGQTGTASAGTASAGT